MFNTQAFKSHLTFTTSAHRQRCLLTSKLHVAHSLWLLFKLASPFKRLCWTSAFLFTVPSRSNLPHHYPLFRQSVLACSRLLFFILSLWKNSRLKTTHLKQCVITLWFSLLNLLLTTYEVLITNSFLHQSIDYIIFFSPNNSSFDHIWTVKRAKT